MATLTKQATSYFDPNIHRALRMKSAETSRSLSEIVKDAVREYNTKNPPLSVNVILHNRCCVSDSQSTPTKQQALDFFPPTITPD